MPKRTTCCFVLLCLLLGLRPLATHAQEVSPEDARINDIRGEETISPTAERQIAEWVQAKMSKLSAAPDAQRPRLAAFTDFCQAFRTLDAPPSSRTFRTQLAVKTAALAVEQFARPGLRPIVGQGLARVLVDMNRMETLEALLAGLKSPIDITRFLCAKGLGALKTGISVDQGARGRVVEALRVAGLAESSPVVLSRIYQGLAYATPANQLGTVVEVYLAVFDKRLDYYRGPAVIIDRAEYDAFEFFRTPAVINALSTEQKTALVTRLAVFLRLYAERYTSPDLDVKKRPVVGDKKDDEDRILVDLDADQERVHIELMLDGVEELLEAIVGSKGGDVRGELRAGGFTRRAEVLAQACLWVGDPNTQTSGALNAAPWNVPIGAP